MSERDKKKGYIPWHQHIDEALIKELTNQFVQTLWKNGMKLSHMQVTWRGDGKFDANTVGSPLTKTAPEKDDSVH